MRILIHAMVLATVVAGLLVVEDVEVGLPVLTLAVWIIVAMTGLFLVLRLNARSRRRFRKVARPRAPRLARLRRMTTRQRTLLLPPR